MYTDNENTINYRVLLNFTNILSVLEKDINLDIIVHGGVSNDNTFKTNTVVNNLVNKINGYDKNE